MNKQIADLSGHYIICGAGENGIHIIRELASTHHPFVAIDSNEARLDKIAATIKPFLFIKGDATEDEVLLAAGVERAKGVAAALPSDKDNLYIIVMAKQYNPGIRIVALSGEDKAISKLQKAGADVVVSSALIGGMRMASEMIRPSVVKFLDRMLRSTEGTVRIEEIHIKAGSRVINKNLSELSFRDQFNLLILGIKPPQTEEIVYNPDTATSLNEDSILFVMGDVDNVHKAREFVKA